MPAKQAKKQPVAQQLTVEVDDKRFTLDKTDVIGSGGEAIIYKHPEKPDAIALKIYHEADSQRDAKLKAFFRKFSFPVQGNVIAPLMPVSDPQGNLVGFAMRRLGERYRVMNVLYKSAKFRADFGFTTKVKSELFLTIGDELEKELHVRGIVVGDLNSANIMIHDQQHIPAWTDVDSMQFDRFPCVARTQHYVSPELYDVADLATRPMFKLRHDWWSFTLLLMQALLDGNHPFRSGFHPQFTSFESRARNGITILDQEVVYPNTGLPPDILTDELADIMVKILKRQVKDPFPLDALQEYTELLVPCQSCGVWYPGTREQCPGCSQRTALDIQFATKVAGFDVLELITTSGRILHYQVAVDKLYCVAEEQGGVVLYEHIFGSLTRRSDLGLRNPQGAKYGIFQGSTLVICPDPVADNPELFLVDILGQPKPVAKVTTTKFSGGQAVFGCSSRFLYRIAGRMLLCVDRFGDMAVDRPVMQVFEGQTWFTVASNSSEGDELLFGLHREFKEYHYFLVRGGKDGKTFKHMDVALSPVTAKETLKEVNAYFTPTEVLVARKTRRKGVERVLIDIISTDDGSLLRHYVARESADHWERLGGKVFYNGTITHPTDQGVTREDTRKQAMSTMPLTAKYVSEGDVIDRFARNLLVVKPSRVALIVKQ